MIFYFMYHMLGIFNPHLQTSKFATVENEKNRYYQFFLFREPVKFQNAYLLR